MSWEVWLAWISWMFFISYDSHHHHHHIQTELEVVVVVWWTWNRTIGFWTVILSFKLFLFFTLIIIALLCLSTHDSLALQSLLLYIRIILQPSIHPFTKCFLKKLPRYTWAHHEFIYNKRITNSAYVYCTHTQSVSQSFFKPSQKLSLSFEPYGKPSHKLFHKAIHLTLMFFFVH